MRALESFAADLRRFEARRFSGRLVNISGLLLEADGPPAALALGAQAVIEGARPIRAEIIGFRGAQALLMPFDPVEGLRPGASVAFVEQEALAAPSESWLGRVLDAFGAPIDQGPAPSSGAPRPLLAPPLLSQARQRVGPRLNLGVRAVDVFAACCRGQRMGLFAGSGVGKSVLLSMLAKGASADVIVIGLIGERGREVREFVEDTLGPDGRKRAVVIAATSDEPPLRRRRAAYLATAVAEHFRDAGKQVLLLIDSVTRFAMAGREIGLAAGEPPTTKGYTPTVFADLPRLLERAGPGLDNGQAGAITALYTVLVDGDDHNEPIADAVRGILDGHIVLDRKIAERGRYPAINVLKSLSRLMPHCHAPPERELVTKAKALLARYADLEDLIRIGAYQRGADPEVDQAIALYPALEGFLAQKRDERSDFNAAFTSLSAILEPTPSKPAAKVISGTRK